MKKTGYFNTHIGVISIVQEEGGISRIQFGVDNLTEFDLEQTDLMRSAAAQISEYFAGKRKVFDLPLHLRGTEFQLSVWRALQTIPYGETRSYKEIAALIGKERGVRAVGMANNRNPIAIIVPCHRVIGAGGDLVGYAVGLEVKRFLLELEKKNG